MTASFSRTTTNVTAVDSTDSESLNRIILYYSHCRPRTIFRSRGQNGTGKFSCLVRVKRKKRERFFFFRFFFCQTTR